MAASKSRTWVGGTFFAAAVIVAAAWFVGISPALAEASELRTQAEDTRAQNAVLDAQIDQLKAQFEKLPEYREELAALQTQVPTDAELSAYLRQLDEIAVDREVTLTTIAVSPAQPVALAQPVAPVAPAPAPAPAPTDGSSPAATPAPDPAASAAPVAPAPVDDPVPTGFTAIPVSITLLGTYDTATAFLSDLQNATPRLFLVAGISGTGQKDGEASGGRPETEVGDLEIVVTGFLYVLPDLLAPTVPVDPAEPAPEMPSPKRGKNPFVPVEGS